MNSSNSGNLCSASYNGMLHPLLHMDCHLLGGSNPGWCREPTIGAPQAIAPTVTLLLPRLWPPL